MAREIEAPEQKARRLQKKLGLSLPGVRRVLDEKGRLDVITQSRSIRGAIRIIVTVRAPVPERWSMAVLFNNRRVDGIDWEQRVKDHRGKAHNCSGWHRHVWKPGTLDANKQCLPKFSPKLLADFLRDGFKLLNVKLERGVRHGEQLPLDQRSPD